MLDGVYATYLQGRKVNYAVDLRVLVEDLVQGRLVGDVDIVKGRALARDELNAVHDFLLGVVEVVNDDHIVACLNERDDCERTNVAAATEGQDALASSVVRASAHEVPSKAHCVATYPVTSAVPTAMFAGVCCVFGDNNKACLEFVYSTVPIFVDKLNQHFQFPHVSPGASQTNKRNTRLHFALLHHNNLACAGLDTFTYISKYSVARLCSTAPCSFKYRKKPFPVAVIGRDFYYH